MEYPMDDTKSTKSLELEHKLQLQIALGKLINKIHSSNLDEILLHVKQDVQKLLQGERVTLYVKDTGKNEIYSKVKDGEDVKEIRVPINSSSLAGFVALHKKSVRISDAYDKNELKQIHPDLSFDSTWDFRSGFRTQQILGVPIIYQGKLQGVIQVINRKNGRPFSEDDEAMALELAQTMGIAFRNQKSIGRRSKFDLLFMQEKLTEEALEKAEAKARAEDTSVEWVLLKDFALPQDLLLQSLSAYFRLDFEIFSDDTLIPVGLLENLDVDYLKHHLIVPIKEEEGAVVVLMANPKNVVSRDDIQSRFGRKSVKFKVALREDIIRYIDYFFKGVQASEMTSDMSDLLGQLDSEMGISQEDEEVKTELSEDDSAIVRLVNQIIVNAYQKGASDVHLEPYPDRDLEVRFRIDGVCKKIQQIPRRYSKAIISRIKIMSGLDIAEKRLPQDGKIKFKNYSTLDIELRVATLPTASSQEDCVMRLLAASEPIPLEKIGMTPENFERFNTVVVQPYGLILVVGPTGSGKTTTLHSALGYINKPETKIWTAEDPVEITQKGLRQVQVQPKIGYTFGRALKAFLRADPDVIMVGEMRDYETTSAGIEASLTGHLVFSTLHTNNAPETVTRLLDMGIDPFSFGDSLLGVLAQRLLRTLCKKCKKPYTPSPDEADILSKEYGNKELFSNLPEIKAGGLQLYKADGCANCGQSGYRGRMGIHELLLSNDELKLLVYNKGKAEEIHRAAVKGGMKTLKQDGIQKILMGHTDLKEVRRVCMK